MLLGGTVLKALTFPTRMCPIHVLSHFYFDVKFGDILYSKEKWRAWPLLF